MGSETSVEKKTKDEVDDKISETNRMTQDNIFCNKTKLFLDFKMEDGCFAGLIKRRIICKVYQYENNAKQKKNKTVALNVSQFYQFYETLMVAFNICIKERVEERNLGNLLIEETDGFDREQCVICNERKVDYKLSCCHFFCTECISVWLSKDRSCPVCREDIPGRKSVDDAHNQKCNWELLEDVQQNILDQDHKGRFEAIMTKLFK